MEDIHGQLMEYNELCKETDALYRQVAECSELSDALFWVLYTVCARKGSCSPKDVCDAWTMHKQTVHSALKKLESQGYIALETAPEDRRSKHILLTEKGERCRSTYFEPLFRAEETAFAQMDREHRTGLLRGCRAYLNELRPAVERLLAPAETADRLEESERKVF